MEAPSQPAHAAVLAAGAGLFAALGILAPARLARVIDSDVDTAREIGIRELGNVLVFAACRDRPAPAIAQRALYDASDALLFGRRKPLVGVAAAAFSGLGVLALFARR